MLVTYVAKLGQRTATLCKAEALFNKLKAFDASINNMASALSASSIPAWREWLPQVHSSDPHTLVLGHWPQ